MVKMINEIGNRYGLLTVIKRAENSSTGQTQWLCICDCGRETIVRGTDLRKGAVKSCTCLRNKLTSIRNSKDETGNRYGKLTVIKRDKNENKKSWHWICKCDCGNTVTIDGKSLRSGNTKSCGCYHYDVVAIEVGRASFNRILLYYRNGARKRNLEFKIDKIYFEKLINGNCFYCGKNPQQIQKGLNGNYVYNGIDRIDNSVGYVYGNVVSCCKNCNRAKADMEIDDFKKWIENLYNNFVKH